MLQSVLFDFAPYIWFDRNSKRYLKFARSIWAGWVLYGDCLGQIVGMAFLPLRLLATWDAYR